MHRPHWRKLLAGLEYHAKPDMRTILSTAPAAKAQLRIKCGAADVARQKHRRRSSRWAGSIGTIHSAVAWRGMDDLLKRADLAIEDSHRIRSQTKEHLARARVTSARVKGTLQWVRAECARSRQLGSEATDKGSSSRFLPAGTMRDRKAQGAADRTHALTIRSTDPAKRD